jgi:hypothetical protein
MIRKIIFFRLDNKPTKFVYLCDLATVTEATTNKFNAIIFGRKTGTWLAQAAFRQKK